MINKEPPPSWKGHVILTVHYWEVTFPISCSCVCVCVSDSDSDLAIDLQAIYTPFLSEAIGAGVTQSARGVSVS